MGDIPRECLRQKASIAGIFFAQVFGQTYNELKEEFHGDRMNFGLVIKDLLMENLMRAQFSGLRKTVENLVISKIMVKQEQLQDSDGFPDVPTDELIKRA